MSARGALDDPLDAPPARDIAAVLDPMRAIVAILPQRDGVAAFTQLYVAVTERWSGSCKRRRPSSRAESSAGSAWRSARPTTSSRCATSSARDAAWVNGGTLWALRHVPLLGDRFVVTLDRTLGFAGRELLRPLG